MSRWLLVLVTLCPGCIRYATRIDYEPNRATIYYSDGTVDVMTIESWTYDGRQND